MTINTVLIDTENFTWDFESGRSLFILGEAADGLAVADGEADTFDSGFMLRVNGTGFNPDRATLDLNGRELNTQALLIGEIAVARSILVSNAALSATGFARFLDSFTNTSDVEQTITVDIALGSGADGDIIVPRTTSGDGTLDTSDTGFVLDDVNTTGGDSALAYVYGDGNSAFGFPSAASQVGDAVAITYTLTLAPGETQSLLSFATQSVTAAEAITDLARFDVGPAALNSGGFLAGLSRDEQLTIQNYTLFQDVQPPFTLVDADGNSWAIDIAGRLSTLDSTALVRFEIPILQQTYDVFQGFLVDEDRDEVTVVRGGFEIVPDSTVAYTYRALADQAVIRLVITWTGGSGGIGNTTLESIVTTGASPALLPNTVTVPDGVAAGLTSGALLDDSESGSGGVLPALSYLFGATGADNTSRSTGSTFSSTSPGQGVGVGDDRKYLYFFALNDDALGGLTDLTRLNTPGPAALIGLSNADLALIQNFDLDAGDRLDPSTGTALDDLLVGEAWGNRIDGLAGNDEIAGGGSDDVLLGGDGNDLIEGGGGTDSIQGGIGDDRLLGGADRDVLRADSGNDTALGGEGDDTAFGFRGNDTLVGGAGNDTLFGELDDDVIEGGSGTDRLQGSAGRDTFVFNAGFGEDRLLDFRNGSDRLDFRTHVGVDGFGDLAVSQSGTATVILDGQGGRIVLAGVTASTIDAADCLF